MLDCDDKYFAIMFRKIFGETPDVFLYRIKEMQHRQDNLEKLVKELTTGALATAVKLEATSKLLDKKNLIPELELYDSMESLHSVCQRIEK